MNLKIKSYVNIQKASVRKGFFIEIWDEYGRLNAVAVTRGELEKIVSRGKTILKNIKGK